MNQLRGEAERLRDEGYSYNMITEALGVSKSTMSYWFKDRPFTPNREAMSRLKRSQVMLGAKRHSQRLKQSAEMKRLGMHEVGELSERDLWMLGLGIYIGEGAKTIEAIRISNSDPAVIQIAMRWLNQCCGLSNENIRIRLHLYPDNDIEAALQYWSGVTGLPLANFHQSHIDIRQNKKKDRRGKLPFGTAHLSVVSRGDSDKGVKLYRKIGGWMAGALQQI